VLLLTLTVLVIVRGIRRARDRGTPDRELVVGSLLALVGFGVALLATFTSPATTILAAFLAGIVVAAPPCCERIAAVRRTRTARTVLLVVWTTAIIVTTLAELPLEAAISDAAGGNISASVRQFGAARALRPWDADITLIEAQSLTSAASKKGSDAIGQALHWAQIAHAQLPGSVLGAKTLAAAQQFDGQLVSATRTAVALNARAPNDPETLARLGMLDAERGLFTQARAVFGKTVRLDPQDAASWNTLRSVDQKLGDTAGVARAAAALAKLGAS